MHPSKLSAEISGWIKARVIEARAKGVVIGMSGGIDSSVSAVLCKNAFPDTTLGLILPCNSPSQTEDVAYARMVAARFGIETKEIDLSRVFTALLSLLDIDIDINIDIATANLKPRLRMVCLYYFANKRNYLVVGTGNKSERSIGYFTKYGDGAADILPLGDMLKTVVRELAEELGIPDEIIEKVSSAGLWEGQTDEAEIGMSYSDLDKIILAMETEDFNGSRGGYSGCDPELVERVRRMADASRHKREAIPVFISSNSCLQAIRKKALINVP